MKIDFWDVGQGDCTIITRVDGSLTLIDVGPKNSPIVSWLREQRSVSISDIVLTHNDADHIGALTPLLEVCASSIKRVWLLQDGNRSRTRQQSVINLLSPLKAAAKKFGIDVAMIRSGLTLWKDEPSGAELSVLYPSVIDAVIDHNTPNLGSAILSLNHPTSGESILWPGDNTVTRADEVKTEHNLWLLHGPHHGAPEDGAKPNRRIFHDPITALAPKRTFISVGSKNKYQHPNLRYLTKLRQLGCKISCSGLTRSCDRRYKERPEGKHVLNGSALLGLRKIANGFSCRGAMRVLVDHEGFMEDEYAETHREAVKSLSHPFCLPRDQWKR